MRAGIDLPAGIRPGGAVESDKLPADVRNRAMEAVDSCGGRVTTGDVSSKAGLKLSEAQKALQALAADTDGFLEVSFSYFNSSMLFLFLILMRAWLIGHLILLSFTYLLVNRVLNLPIATKSLFRFMFISIFERHRESLICLTALYSC